MMTWEGFKDANCTNFSYLSQSNTKPFERGSAWEFSFGPLYYEMCIFSLLLHSLIF